jgi:O-succinylbenzoic acid--CoA ligase
MEQPLILLKNRVPGDWLLGYDSQTLVNLAEQRYQELLQYDSPNVLLVERDPISFIAGFIAACSVPCNLFLCNPDWGQTEWQHVFERVTPTIIWGTSFALSDPLSASLPCAIASSLIYPSSVAIMLPTGGTSGTIRFAIHTWNTLMASIAGFQHYFELDQINSFCVLPLYHVSGLMQMLRSLTSGGEFVILPWKHLEAGHLPNLDPQNFFLSLVPTQLQRLLNQSEWLVQFKTILLGGAPAWTELLEQARSLHLPIAPTYGMTETASQIATLKPQDFLNAQTGCGRVLPHADITIDPQTQQLSIRAKSLMLGYYPMLSNSSTYDPDDLGYFDDRGFLHILGRNSQKIITGGENVFPTEIEAVIRATNLVQDVCVVGLPDSNWGQIIAAVYVPRDVSESELAATIAPQLSKFKQPKRWIAVSQIPRNAQGKINRAHLMQIAQSN